MRTTHTLVSFALMAVVAALLVSHMTACSHDQVTRGVDQAKAAVDSAAAATTQPTGQAVRVIVEQSVPGSSGWIELGLIALGALQSLLGLASARLHGQSQKALAESVPASSVVFESGAQPTPPRIGPPTILPS